MLRLTGAALLLGAAFLLRQDILARGRRRRDTLRALAGGFLALERAVRLTLSPLPALLHELSCAPEADAFFSAVSARLAAGQTLERAWREEAQRLPLDPREREAVALLGTALGGGEDGVCTALAQASELLAQQERALASAARAGARVTTALCLGGGTLLVILLL